MDVWLSAAISSATARVTPESARSVLGVASQSRSMSRPRSWAKRTPSSKASAPQRTAAEFWPDECPKT